MRELVEKLMKRYYGIEGVLDEYREAQIDRLGNRAFFGLLLYVIGGSLVTLGLIGAGVAPMTVAIGFSLANLLVVLIINSVIKTAVNKLALNQVDVTTENFTGYLHAMRWRTAGEAVWYAVTFVGVEWVIEEPQMMGSSLWHQGLLVLIELGVVWYALYFPRRAALEDALMRTQKEE